MTTVLPDCMAPDGAEPCKGYLELQEAHKRLLEAAQELVDEIMQSGTHERWKWLLQAGCVARAPKESKPHQRP